MSSSVVPSLKPWGLPKVVDLPRLYSTLMKYASLVHFYALGVLDFQIMVHSIFIKITL